MGASPICYIDFSIVGEMFCLLRGLKQIFFLIRVFSLTDYVGLTTHPLQAVSSMFAYGKLDT